MTQTSDRVYAKRPWDGIEEDDRYPVPWDAWTYGFDTTEGIFVVLQQMWRPNKKTGSMEAEGKPLNPSKFQEFTKEQVDDVFAEAETSDWPLKTAVIRSVKSRRLGEAELELIASAPSVYSKPRTWTEAAKKRKASDALADIQAQIATTRQTKKPEPKPALT